MKWVKFKETTQAIPVLLLDCVSKSFNKYFTPMHDGKTRIRFYRQALDARWLGEEGIKNYKRMLKSSTPQKLLSFARNYRQEKIKLESFSVKISNENWREKSREQLLKAFSQYVDLCARGYHFAYDYVILNSFYSEEINSLVLKYVKDKAKFNYYLQHIAGLDKPTDMHLEQKSLGNLALHAKEKGFDSLLKKRIAKHAKDYGYLNQFTYFGEPYTEKDIKKRIKQLIAKEKAEIIKETIGKFNQIAENKRVTEQFIKSSALGQSEKMKIAVLKDYLYTSIWADEFYHKIPFLVKPLLLEICRQSNIAYNQLIQMTSDEIVEVLKNGVSKSLLDSVNERIKGFAFVYEEGKVNIFTGNGLKTYCAAEIKKEKELQKLSEIKGNSAYPGKVKGTAKIIYTLDDINNFKQGHILIASNTAPTHVPAMQKAAAIVTNEGGLLSHAAIIAREMKKPCVIGTDIATKVFKDGDIVEVDADKGIVKRL
jgi:phosphohistidine swiveling domain-containing protein